MSIEIFNNCAFDSNKIQTLYIGSRLVSGNPIVYPINYITVSGSSDSIIAIEAWDYNNNTITIGSQEIMVNKIVNTGDNISFNEELIINENGKIYQKNISFTIPNITLFLLNQIKEFVITSAGLFALAPTIAMLIDDNDQKLIVGYNKALYLQNKEIKIGEDNSITLSYQSNSYSRAKAWQVII